MNQTWVMVIFYQSFWPLESADRFKANTVIIKIITGVADELMSQL